ncbi:MAG TPA: hypothetical protein VGC65_07905 [Bacteroidia bacterium]
MLLFLVKTIAGMAVLLVYTYYYPSSDFHLYFRDSKTIVDHFFSGSSHFVLQGWNSSFDEAFFNNSRVIISINVLLQLFSFNNIFVHILFFCFFSFIGLTALYKAFLKYFPQKNFLLVIGIYLVPSVLFWTAGIYKETVSIACVGLLIYTCDFGLQKAYSRGQLLFTVFLIVALFFVKIHVAAAIIPLLAVNYFFSRSGNKKLGLKYLLVFLSLLLMVHLLSIISEKSNVYKMIADKQAKAISEAEGGMFLLNDRNFIRVDHGHPEILEMQSDSSFRIKKGSSYLSWKLDNMRDTSFISNSTDSSVFQMHYAIIPVKTVVNVDRLEPSFWIIMKNLPFAIACVIIQPSIFNIANGLQLLAAVENMWLMLLIILALVFFDKKILKHKEIVFFSVFFALIQFAEIGLMTPAVGAMVRYKVTALPFLVTACLLCIDFPAIGRLLMKPKSPDSYKE